MQITRIAKSNHKYNQDEHLKQIKQEYFTTVNKTSIFSQKCARNTF